MTEEDEDPFRDELESRLDAIETRQDLSEYLQFLADGFRAGEFEEQSVADYLDGASAITEALISWLQNMGEEPTETASWKLVGMILTGAFQHS